MANSSQSWTKAVVALERPAFLQRLPALLPLAQRAWLLAVVALIGAWLGFYLITPLPYIELETFRATVVLHAVTGLVFVPYLASLIVWRRLPGGSALDAPLVGLLGAYVLATAGSLDWRLSLEVTLTVVMALGVFYVLSDGRLFRRWQIETAFMLAVLAAALKALWIVGGDYLDWLRLTEAVRGGMSLGDLIPPTVPKVHDVGDHPNIVGGILAMSLPFFFAGIFRPMHAGLRVLATAGALAIALALFLTLARSAWTGATVGVAITGVLLATATPTGRGALRRLWPRTMAQRWLAAGAAFAALAAIAAFATYSAQSIDARPIWLFRASDAPRWEALQAGAEMVRDYPLLGTGPGLYNLLYHEYSDQFPAASIDSHNGFLQAAIDMGVPGVAAMLALGGAAGWLIVRALRRSEDGAQFSLAASAGALVAFGIFSLFNVPTAFKSSLVALAAVGAIAVLAARESQDWDETFFARLTPSWSRVAAAMRLGARAIVPVAMAGVLITWGVRLDIAHFHFSNAQNNANAGRLAEAAEEAQLAVNLDPSFTPYRLQLGTIFGKAYQEAGDPVLLRDALAELERAVELEPRSAFGHANMALLLANGGDRERAREEALAALRYANGDSIAALVAGTALEAANRGNDAVQAYARALFLNAGLADSPFWEGTPFRREHFDDIIGSSALVFNKCLQLRLASQALPHGALTRTEALDACRAQVQRAPNNERARITLANVLIEDSDLDGARAHIDFVLTRQPDFGPARTALGLWYDARGETEQARREWVRAGQLGELEALVLLGDSYPPERVPAEVVDRVRTELRNRNIDRHLVGILYYRFKFFRRSPNDIFLPGEWQQAVPGSIARANEALERWAEG